MAVARNAERTILQNIYNFLEVLQISHGRKVKEWTSKSVQDAFQWAEYCEEVSRHANGKVYWQELNDYVFQLAQLPWAIGDQPINLDTLQHASSTIGKALLQNPNINQDVLETVLCHFSKDLKNPSENLIQLLSEMGQLHGSVRYATNIVDYLLSNAPPVELSDTTCTAAKQGDPQRSCGCGASDHNKPYLSNLRVKAMNSESTAQSSNLDSTQSDINSEVGLFYSDAASCDKEAELLLRFLNKAVAHQQWSESFVAKILKRFWESSHGVNIMLRIVMRGDCDDTDSGGSKCCSFILCQLLKEADISESLLWKVCPQTLGSVASKHQPFFKVYINRLLSQTKMQRLENDGTDVHANLEYQWRGLLDAAPWVASAARAALTSTAKQTPGCLAVQLCNILELPL